MKAYKLFVKVVEIPDITTTLAGKAGKPRSLIRIEYHGLTTVCKDATSKGFRVCSLSIDAGNCV